MFKRGLAFAAAAVSTLGGKPISADVQPAALKSLPKMLDRGFLAHWRAHPGRNPRYFGGGRRYHERSRWVPHIGAKELARHGGSI